MSVIFVTHDIGVAVEVSDRIAVMYAGAFVETGTTREIIREAQHPYTHGLLAANLVGAKPGQRLDAIPGAPPALETRPTSCAFAPRCKHAMDVCREALPPTRRWHDRRWVSCVLAAEDAPRPAVAASAASV